jgi:hypothetical protein
LIDPAKGAQRASSGTFRAVTALALAALALTFSVVPAFAATPAALVAAAPAALAGQAATTVLTATTARPKVVVIVGPVGSATARYIADARRLAAQARSYGAAVTELYSPNATWTRVRTALAGANLLIYLGHGNGYPSPYAGGQDSHNGLGLNASASGSDSNVKYYGETYVANYVHLAPNAVVILNHLCYASGNNEWGKGNPTRSVAIQRVDNYGEGFLRAGAAAVFAEGITDPGYILASLFHTSRSMGDIFWASPNATHSYAIAFTSRNVTGAKAEMDPYEADRYYRSVIGGLTVTAADWR